MNIANKSISVNKYKNKEIRKEITKKHLVRQKTTKYVKK